MAFIQHQFNGAIINHYPLEGRLTIGRSKDSDITIDDATVSGEHAVIEVVGEPTEAPDKFEVRDLSSTNGVTVNGNKVECCELKAGDVIVVGTHDFELIYELPSDMDKTLRIKKSWIPGVYYTEK